MKLKKLTLRDYRGVADSVVEFSETVTVVEGPNEVGKSSLAEAMVLLRESKDSSKAKAVRDVKPIGKDTGPFVELQLQLGGASITYRKQWLKNPRTELEIGGPSPLQLSGDSAHDYFEELLSKQVDTDLLEAMTINQGESLEQAQLAKITALQNALHKESGPGVAEGHDEVLKQIEQEYSLFFTRTGKPAATFKEVLARRNSLAESVESLLQESTEVDEKIEEHAQRSKDLVALQTKLTKARQVRAEKEKEVQALETVRNAQDEAKRATDLAAQSLLDAQRFQQQRTEMIASLAERSEEIKELEEQLSVADSQLATGRSEAGKAMETLQLRIETEKEARLLVDGDKRRRDMARAKKDLARLDRLEKDASKQEETLRIKDAQVAANPVKPEVLEQIESLAVELRVAKSSRLAGASTVIVEQLGEEQVLLDGRHLNREEPGEIAVLEPVSIEVPGVVSVQVVPGAFAADPDGAEQKIHVQLETVLSEIGVRSVEEARRLGKERAEDEKSAALASSAVTHLLGDTTLEEVRQASRQLKVEVDRWRSEELEQDASFEVRGGDTEALADNLAARMEELEEARLDFEKARGREEAAREAQVRCAEALSRANREQKDLQASLEKVRIDRTDEALGHAVSTAEERVARASATQREAESQLEAMDPDGLQTEWESAKQVVETLKMRHDQTRDAVTQLEALLEYWSQQGIHDRLGEAEASLELAESEAERIERRAAAVELLRAVMLKHKDEVQRKYVAPFKTKMEQLGRVVFGETFQVDISPELKVLSRTLGGVTVPFEDLSAGAREQISLLGRLASATLVDRTDGAPVILDDTMGFADPRRLESLNAVLMRAASAAQIIILTCQPDRFDALGGASFVSLQAAGSLPDGFR